MMQQLENRELIQVVGGINISGTLLNSFSNLLKTIHSLGRNFGSALRRISVNDLCSL